MCRQPKFRAMRVRNARRREELLNWIQHSFLHPDSPAKNRPTNPAPRPRVGLSRFPKHPLGTVRDSIFFADRNACLNVSCRIAPGARLYIRCGRSRIMIVAASDSAFWRTGGSTRISCPVSVSHNSKVDPIKPPNLSQALGSAGCHHHRCGSEPAAKRPSARTWQSV